MNKETALWYYSPKNHDFLFYPKGIYYEEDLKSWEDNQNGIEYKENKKDILIAPEEFT